jgi:hypothetical protein
MGTEAGGVSKKKVVEALWRKGSLRYLLRPGQKLVYDQLQAWIAGHTNDPGPLVLLAHRGFGKSFTLLLMCLEWALQKPFQNIRYGGPQYEQTVEIVEHNISAMLHHELGFCPESCYPTVKNEYIEVRNPAWGDLGRDAFSRIWIFGTNKKVGEATRGKRSNKVVVDELGWVTDVDYVLSGILGGTFIGQTDPLMLLSSTPPRSAAHPFSSKFVPEAHAAGRLVKITVNENPDFRREDRMVLMSMCGNDISSAAWRREGLCEMVSDAGLLALPSFPQARVDGCEGTWERPSHYFPLWGADFGFRDYNGVVFGYVDYLAQKLIIEREFFRNAISTKELVDHIKGIEHDLWKDAIYARGTRRWADATAQQLADFALVYDLLVENPKAGERWDRWSGLATLDAYFRQRRIVIHPSCKNLLFQLANAVKNEKLTDLERTVSSDSMGVASDRPAMGHCDLLWALAYLVHQAHDYFNQNPYPEDAEIDYTDKHVGNMHLIPEKKQSAIRVTHTPLMVTRRKNG